MRIPLSLRRLPASILGSFRPVGVIRWARAAGIASAAIAGLELTQQHAIAWGTKLATRLQPELSDIAFWKGDHTNGPFIVYVLLLVIVLGVVF